MNYQKAEDYIYSLPKFTTKNSLEHTRQDQSADQKQEKTE